ncbi:MAG: rhomboid family intramembrane serine protease [Actinomycetota bacterium]|nr:rhomboid family intramembrane serine protease [Actinomycetota bacterium]
MSEPDLFVICKNCSAEVSPYVTECPYCGQRVRKRAPKLDKGGVAEPRAGRRLRPPSLPRLRPDEIPGIAPETTPYATAALVAVSLLATLVLTALPGSARIDAGGVFGSLGGEWWRLATTPFVYATNLGYQFVALVAVAVFGMHLERRFGPVAPVAVFLLAGAAGGAAALALGLVPAYGGNGAALGLLCAWLVDDRLALARGDDRGNDMIGVYVFAAVLVLLSLAEPTASLGAAAGGAAAGAILGLLMATLRR